MEKKGIVTLQNNGKAKSAADMEKFKSNKGGAIRYNQDKLRYELIHPKANEDFVKVLSMGAKKYSIISDDGDYIYDGSYNWRKGFSWTSVLASLKRHIAAFEMGEDYDPESGHLHIAHAACNVHFLNTFYYIFPQGDDRVKTYIPKIGLDIDDVLAAFVDKWVEKYEIQTPKFWMFDRKMNEKFEKMKVDGELNSFYLGIKPLIDPNILPFEPHCYITSRPVPSEVTEKWIDDNGFPQAPVYTVPLFTSKVNAARESGVEVFVDDSYKNFKELNENGITCFLFDRPHNKRYDVGHLRIKTLNDLPWFKK